MFKENFSTPQINEASSIIPIKNGAEELYSFSDNPKTYEDKDIIFKHRIYIGAGHSEGTGYFLKKEIAGDSYEFKLISNPYNPEADYRLSFKTTDYEYARMSLGEEDQEKIFITISEFLESVYTDAQISQISISPAGTAYSKDDIDKCIDEILKSEEALKNSWTKEILLGEKYKYSRIFDLYSDIYEKDFEYSNKDKTLARSRFFKAGFKKYLKSWNLSEKELSNCDFYLERV